VSHGDAVVNGNTVKLFGDGAVGLNFPGHPLPHLPQVDMSGDELGEGVDDGDDGAAEFSLFDARSSPESACAGHVAAMGGNAGTVGPHGVFLATFGLRLQEGFGGLRFVCPARLTYLPEGVVNLSLISEARAAAVGQAFEKTKKWKTKNNYSLQKAGWLF
jgi:hypothetical protein